MSRSKTKESSLIRGRGFLSVHYDLNYLRLDEEFTEDEDEVVKDTTEEEEIYQMSAGTITEETADSYRRIIEFYSKLIALKYKMIDHKNEDSLFESMSTIYELTLQKYSWWSELLAFEN